MSDNQQKDHRGKRALMLLRVSTPEQEKGFGWPSQEREIRQKLISPLGLKLDEEKHILRDTYTGLEFRERPALERILEMAQRHEFDILVTDVLDRLGRKGLPRELYRMQLRELGVHILTTDPNDHADDDSLMGEMIRILKGYQAEEELNNTRRRSMNAKRTKLEGDQQKGIEPRVGGDGHRYYGYKFVLDDRGKRIGVSLNHDVIKVDEDGTEWTEVKVIIYIFESAASGVPLRQIAKALNERGIPTPYVTKSIQSKRMKHPLWQTSAISRITRNSVYYGEARFKKVNTHKVGGGEIRVKTSIDDQIVVSVPPIITKELAEDARKRVASNSQYASRNNSNPEATLLRGGFVKCGHCGSTMRVQPHKYIRKDGSVHEYFLYSCGLQQAALGVCKGCSILTNVLDEEVWKKVLEIISDPSQIDKRVNAFKSDDPTASRRKIINKKLKEVREQQEAMRQNLASFLKMRQPDMGTIEFLNTQLQTLADQEEGYTRELSQDQYEYEKWKLLQIKVDAIHEKCAQIRENLDDPNYELSYQVKRDVLTFLGIQAIVWKKKDKPKFEIQCSPPSIATLLSAVAHLLQQIRLLTRGAKFLLYPQESFRQGQEASINSYKMELIRLPM